MKVIEDQCDVCGFTYEATKLIAIDGKLMDPICVKQHVACLMATIERLEEEKKQLQNS